MQGWGWRAALKGFWINNDAELSVLEGSAGIDIRSCSGLSVIWVPNAATVTGACHTGRIGMNSDLSLLQTTGVKVLGRKPLKARLALQFSHSMGEFLSQRNTRACSATGTHGIIVSLLPESTLLLPLCSFCHKNTQKWQNLWTEGFYLKFYSGSQNHWVWKRPPRSSIPAFDPVPPYPLNQITHISEPLLIILPIKACSYIFLSFGFV